MKPSTGDRHSHGKRRPDQPCEIFDETDLDAALARFDELHTQAPRLENAATRAEDRYFAYYKAHDWAAIAEILADDTFIENRVRVVNTGLWEGRDVVIANMQALAEAVAHSTSAVLAVRGERLALTHMRYPNSDTRYGEFRPRAAHHRRNRHRRSDRGTDRD